MKLETSGDVNLTAVENGCNTTSENISKETLTVEVSIRQNTNPVCIGGIFITIGYNSCYR
ncbi:MAG TPA: hypothetical protein ENI57_01595 [Ignavibacteria bacterium]|nr:hypothetical protein [Ignavibacteria bacterium]